VRRIIHEIASTSRSTAGLNGQTNGTVCATTSVGYSPNPPGPHQLSCVMQRWIAEKLPVPADPAIQTPLLNV
jgi:hypothetical protein